MKKQKAAVLFGFWFAMGTAWAGQAITPLTARHIGAPGDTQQGQFMVTNPYPYDVEVKFDISNQGYTGGGPAPLPKGNWIAVTSPTPFIVKPDQTVPLQYTVTFPPALTKESVGLLTLVVVRVGDSMGIGLVRRGLPIYFVPGSAASAPALTMGIASARFVEGLTGAGSRFLEASFFVQNTGDVQLKPEGSLTLTSAGAVLETCPLTGQGPLLPGASLPFTGRTAGSAWKDGDYQAFVVIGYGDAYGKPLKIEKTYSFRVSGQTITVSPGSASPETVSPR